MALRLPAPDHISSVEPAWQQPLRLSETDIATDCAFGKKCEKTAETHHMTIMKSIINHLRMDAATW